MAHAKLCSIDGCGRRTLARGWCRAHYRRWERHGDPLAGATGRGEAARYYHDVVLSYTGNDCLFWPFGRDKDGYAKVGGNPVHRVLCEHFNGPAPTALHQVAHSCGQGHNACVAPQHIRWATPAENQADRLLHDTHARGERHVLSKLTEADVRQIQDLRGQMTQREIAERFAVSAATVSAIHNGRNWAWMNAPTRAEEQAKPKTYFGDVDSVFANRIATDANEERD